MARAPKDHKTNALRELDAATCEEMLRLVDESVGGRLLILVTHDRMQAERLGCRVVEMPV